MAENSKGMSLKVLLFAMALNSYYFGTGSMFIFAPFFGVAIFGIRSISRLQLFSLFSLITFSIFKIVNSGDDFFSGLIDIRYFWSFFIFYLYFISLRRNASGGLLNYEKILVPFFYIAIILVLAEFFTNNYLGWEWPVRGHDASLDREDFGHARSYGFGANATVTSVLLILLSFYLRRRMLWDVVTLAFATSGTAFFLFLTKFFLKQKFCIILCALGFAYFLYSISTENLGNFSKISIDYVHLVLDVKTNQIDERIMNPNFNWVWGARDLADLRTGDFQAFDFILYNGIFGVLLFALMVVSAINRANFFLVAAMIATTFHYQVIFSLPGSVLFGLFLSIQKSSIGEPFFDHRPLIKR